MRSVTNINEAREKRMEDGKDICSVVTFAEVARKRKLQEKIEKERQEHNRKIIRNLRLRKKL
jgi:hypothetical protein